MREMNISEIMDRSIDTLKKYISTIILFTISYGAILIALSTFFIILASILMLLGFMLFKNTIFMLVTLSIFSFILFGFGFSSSIGIIKIASQEFLEMKIVTSSALGASFKNILRVLGILVIAFITFIPAIGLFCAMAYFLYKIFITYSKFIYGNSTGIIIYSIICIIASLVVILVVIGYIALFSFSFQVLTIEQRGIIASIKRSFTLIKHNFFKIYISIVIFSITVYLIRYSFIALWGLLISLLFLALKFFNLDHNFTTFLPMLISYANFPISIISWCLISPLSTIMLTQLYFNQRFKKEGYDLTLKLKKIEREQLNDKLKFN